MKKMLLLILFYYMNSLNSQCEKLKIYKHFTIESKTDTINYHGYAESNIKDKKNILIFIQGSNSKPFYSYFKKEGKSYRGSTMPFDLKTIPKNYAFFIVSKKGMVFCSDSVKEFEVSNEYYSGLTLKYRATQIDRVIEDITVKLVKKPEKIVVIGHSEGSDVVAKLGTINKKITHVGFWSGSGNSQWYDFPLFIRKEVLTGKISEEEALVKMDSLFVRYRDIMQNKDNVRKKWYGHPYKRWFHFSEAPIDNLLQIDVPLYVAMGAKDNSVPIESTYLIPIEFIRKGKENLTFKVYPQLNHSFQNVTNKDKVERYWGTVFSDFMTWVEKN